MTGEYLADSLSQADSWLVVSKFFEKYNLACQQIDSFNEFTNEIMTIIGDTKGVEARSTPQYGTNENYQSRTVHQIKFGRATYQRPKFTEKESGTGRPIFPNDARLRKLTYDADLNIELHSVSYQTGTDGMNATDDLDKTSESKTEFFGKIPVMVRSDWCQLQSRSARKRPPYEFGECSFDQGGYFIVKGAEKVIITQERQSYNRPYCFQSKRSNVAWSIECRSSLESTNRMPSTIEMNMKKDEGDVNITLPYMLSGTVSNEGVPVCVVFRGYNCTSDRAIMRRVVYDEEDFELMEAFRPSLEAAQVIEGQETALDFIARRADQMHDKDKPQRVKYARDVLKKEVLPHITSKEYGHVYEEGFNEMPDPNADNEEKVYYLGYMVNKLLQTSLGRIEPDDRDHFANKRLDLAGPMMAKLFRKLFNEIRKSMEVGLKKAVTSNELPNISALIPSKKMTTNLSYALATGNWDIKSGGPANATGVSQELQRLTFSSALSHLRRINSPIPQQSKDPKPRQLHNTQWGMICPCETPEGGKIGIVKNLSLMASVTVPLPPEFKVRLRNALVENVGLRVLNDIFPGDILHTTKVFFNGNWIGVVDNPESMFNMLRQARATYPGYEQISVRLDAMRQELIIWTDGGRASRPLLKVTNNQVNITEELIQALRMPHSTVTWDELVEGGVVEMIDVSEEECCMVAMSPSDLKDEDSFTSNWTHCEIHPAMVLGVCASVIPFPDHNQSPRNTYQSAMGKQALGIYTSNFDLRFDTTGHVLFYPQIPLVITEPMKYMNFRELPAGINACVAIATYTGYNQEDSLIMNQSAIDRGLFRSSYYRSISEEAHEKVGFDKMIFEKPDFRECNVGLRRQGAFNKMDIDGLPYPGCFITDKDFLIGKTLSISNSYASSSVVQKRDKSIKMKAKEQGVVDKVMLTTNQTGNKFVQIRVRSVRIPQVGDKFSSRHGQKGTIGMTYRQEDMPFTQEGITPDIIVNPHAVPSRMTIGQLIECLLGKVAALTGKTGDATAFLSELTVDKVANQLHLLGYQRYGNETMFNGHTGRPMEGQIFIGPTYYQRLKHLVADKIHARATGQVERLTRQPTHGRARGGGLRFGEMERDCFISHGVSSLLRERTMTSSDGYEVLVCDRCGLMCTPRHEGNTIQPFCHCSDNEHEISRVEMPYACKLLFQELMAMAIAPRIFTKK
eukprot:TRINITY_DN284_c0_g2_i1.p1 TRINITY_DN284_c0_g2~~TRINITY_DN284_c0_g2_i1.p1  ORF type:complete len:1190 (-),score=385.43 TRINITY_DN284_c0_g2_i1:234-3803(-)